MADVAVTDTIHINTPQLALRWIEHGEQHLGIMDIFQREFRRHNIVGYLVYQRPQMAPSTQLLGALFPDLRLAPSARLSR